MHEVPPNIFTKRHPASIDPQRSTIPLRIFLGSFICQAVFSINMLGGNAKKENSKSPKRTIEKTMYPSSIKTSF